MRRLFSGFCCARTLSAQELSTDAERTYNELRKSRDTKTQLLAERWYNAVKLQEWTSKSGKFKTTAKYVEHDPELAWVKLRIITGTGDKRVVKDVTIPLAELNKLCQSRVRQISVLAEKVAAAAAAEKEKANEKESTEMTADGAAGGMAENRMMAEEPRDRRGGREAGLAGMDAEQAIAEGDRPQRSRRAEAAAPPPSPSATSGPALPALLPPLPSDRLRLGNSASSTEAPQAPPAESR